MILPHLSITSSFWAMDVCSLNAPCITYKLAAAPGATACRQTKSASTLRASTTQTTNNGNRLKFINNLQIRVSQPNLQDRVSGRARRYYTNDGSVEDPASGIFDCVHHQRQICIERALHLLAHFAGAIPRLFLTHRTDVAPDGVNILADVVAHDRLNGLGHLGEETKQRAIGGALQAALALGGPFRADTTNPVPDNGL